MMRGVGNLEGAVAFGQPAGRPNFAPLPINLPKLTLQVGEGSDPLAQPAGNRVNRGVVRRGSAICERKGAGGKAICPWYLSEVAIRCRSSTTSGPGARIETPLPDFKQKSSE